MMYIFMRACLRVCARILLLFSGRRRLSRKVPVGFPFLRLLWLRCVYVCQYVSVCVCARMFSLAAYFSSCKPVHCRWCVQPWGLFFKKA